MVSFTSFSISFRGLRRWGFWRNKCVTGIILKFGSINTAVDYLANSIISKIDAIINLYEKYPLLLRDPFTAKKIEELKELRKIIDNKDATVANVEMAFKIIKSTYQKNEKEKQQSNKTNNQKERSSDAFYTPEFNKWYYSK